MKVSELTFSFYRWWPEGEMAVALSFSQSSHGRLTASSSSTASPALNSSFELKLHSAPACVAHSLHPHCPFKKAQVKSLLFHWICCKLNSFSGGESRLSSDWPMYHQHLNSSEDHWRWHLQRPTESVARGGLDCILTGAPTSHDWTHWTSELLRSREVSGTSLAFPPSPRLPAATRHFGSSWRKSIKTGTPPTPEGLCQWTKSSITACVEN